MYERQTVEEQIVNEHLYPKSGKAKEIPSPYRMRSLVDARISEKRNGAGGPGGLGGPGVTDGE